MTTTPTERRREIGKLVRKAIAGVTDIDCTKESPAITEAQAGLDEAIALFVEERASKADVQKAGKEWVNAHRGGLFG